MARLEKATVRILDDWSDGAVAWLMVVDPGKFLVTAQQHWHFLQRPFDEISGLLGRRKRHLMYGGRSLKALV